ncbi:MAG: FlgD immunoglobulin-like domain containing protein [Candidatus Eisenbacteria bacterium]
MRAIEVVNGRASEDYEVQFKQALANGWKVGPFGNQDNHQGMWGDQQNLSMGGDIYLTGIWADGLNRADVMAALRARRFYAMEVDPPTDRIELQFSVDGSPMGSIVTTGPAPTFAVTARAVNGTGLFNRIEIYRDGTLAHQKVGVGNVVTDSWQDFIADGESHYYFAKVYQVDQDRAWSAPVWVTGHVAPSDAPTLEPVIADLRLLSTRPNPFTPDSELRFILPPRIDQEDYRVRITIHDVNGRLVRDLGTRALSGGEHAWNWDGNDDQGRSLASGVYLYRVNAAGLPERSARLVLLH